MAITFVMPCEKPTVDASAHWFFRLLSTMLIFYGFVDAKLSGSLPPYGSGYDGLLMLMAA
jgi:hypothetical protein